MLPYINIPSTSSVIAPMVIIADTLVPEVPFYSQLTDIQSASWKKRGCGVASLAMLIEFYKPGSVSINNLLKQAIASGAYLPNVGWKHKELALLSREYTLEGRNYDLSSSDKKTAFAEFSEYLQDGPVIASVHYNFDPKSTIPHLVVINGIDGDTVYYNDPAAPSGQKKISTTNFLRGWKKRFIVVRPTKSELALMPLPFVTERAI